jgi:ubiquitin-like domain-containing CTD phosphatase 1
MTDGSSYVEQSYKVHQESTDEPADSERWINLLFSWSGKPFALDIAESDRYDVWVAAIDICGLLIAPFRVFDLKAALFSLTNVPPERQKILGLVKGKLPPDEVRV